LLKEIGFLPFDHRTVACILRRPAYPHSPRQARPSLEYHYCNRRQTPLRGSETVFEKHETGIA